MTFLLPHRNPSVQGRFEARNNVTHKPFVPSHRLLLHCIGALGMIIQVPKNSNKL